MNHAFAFVDPDPAHPAWFERARVVDVAAWAPSASQLPPVSGAEERDRFAALFTPADAALTVRAPLPSGPLFLWVQPQAVGDAAVRFELRVIPAQGDPLAWQGAGGGDVRLALDTFQGQTVAISFGTTGGDGRWGTPWILAGTPHRWDPSAQAELTAE